MGLFSKFSIETGFGFGTKNDLVPTPHTLKGIQSYLVLLVSYQNLTLTFAILGIGIPTLEKGRAFLEDNRFGSRHSCWLSK